MECGLYTFNVLTSVLLRMPRLHCSPRSTQNVISAGLVAGAFLLCATQSLAQVVPWQTTPAPAIDATALPEDQGADGLAQTLGKLRTWASLMMIVAHPDDEDGGMMTYESRGAGVRTTLMTLTRGEGGQNAINSETYDLLGLLRTNELLAADRYSGTQQLWGTQVDFGFSKTKEESFEQWGHDRVLRDVVRAIRQQRPLVLTAVFIGGVTDGHGQHQVSGEIAQEAFNAAGDPSVFPDQIAEGLRPWKPLAVFARVPFARITPEGMYDYATDSWAPLSFTNYVTGEQSKTPPSTDVSIPEGQWDPVLGQSYFQMAREGWSLQMSQYGGGYTPLAGPNSVGYHRYGSRVNVQGTQPSLFSGIDTSLPGMAMLAQGGDTAFVIEGLRRIDRAVTHAFWGYTPAVPDRIAPDLREGYLATQSLLDQVQHSGLTPDSKADLEHELRIKLVQFNTALVEALGLHLDAMTTPMPESGLNGTAPRELSLSPDLTSPHVAPGETFDVRLHLASATPWSSAATAGLQLLRTGLTTPAGERWNVARTETPGLDTVQSSVGETIFRVEAPRDASPTQPYFSRPSIEQPYYDLHDQKLSGQSFAPYPLSGWAEWNYNGVPLRLSEVVQSVQREHGIGTFREPLVVTPALSVSLPQAVTVLPSGASAIKVTASVANEANDPAEGTLRLTLPEGWSASPANTTFSLQPGEHTTQSFTVQPPPGGLQPSGNYIVRAEAQSGNTVYKEGFTTSGYARMRSYNLYRPAQVQVRAVDMHVLPGARVGYVMGTGDSVPTALSAIGVPVDELTASDLLKGGLDRYSAIVLGVRTYTVDHDLPAASAALQRYARAGGTVVIQYQSDDFPGLPYSLHIKRGQSSVVADERAPVSVLAPDNSLLTTPNRITAADFNNWVEERGHGFAASWSPQWVPLVSTQDPGQSAQRGGLLVAPVGKGRYVYMAAALYRQLPEGVPGAYRLLANLVGGRDANAQ